MNIDDAPEEENEEDGACFYDLLRIFTLVCACSMGWLRRMDGDRGWRE